MGLVNTPRTPELPRELSSHISSTVDLWQIAMNSMLQSSTQTRKTNSLGRAKSPCPDCQQSGLLCDRARPRCSTCINNGTVCRGYKMDLRWQLGVASKGNLAGFSYPAPTAVTASLDIQDQHVSKKRRWRGKTSKATGDRHFRFVEGNSADRLARKSKSAPKPKSVPSKSGMAKRPEKSPDFQPTFESPGVSPVSLSFLTSPDVNEVVVDTNPDCVNTLNESSETFSLDHNQTCCYYEGFDTPRIYPEEDTNEETSDANTCRALSSLNMHL
ncbi:unnamed protein product [Penicillium pancosmium]